MVVGENGVLNRAKNAATDTATAQAQEALSMAVSGLQGIFADEIAKGTNQEFISYIWYGGEKPASAEPAYAGDKGKTALQGQLSDYTITDFSSSNEKGPITVKMSNTSGSTWTFYIKESGSIGATVSDKS